MPILELKRHYRRFFGPEGESFVLTGTLPDPERPLEAPYFGPENEQRFAVFATAGASAHVMPDGRRIEGVLLFRVEPDLDQLEHVQRLLAAFAAFPEITRADLSLGDVIDAQDLLAPLSRMDSIVLVPPIPRPGLERCTLGSGVEVEVVWILPVYEQEADYAIAHGPEVLLLAMAEQNIDPMDLTRAPLDTTRVPPDVARLRARLDRPKPKRASFEAHTRDGVITITRKPKR